MKRFVLMAVFAWSSFFASAVSGAEPFEFGDGDRVVLIGNTLIEREQRYGYWETAITARYPKRNITFRNLGWSGDTVFGDAQAGFGSAADGFKHLVEHVRALKPTVLIMGFGGVEAFEGEKGLERFEKGFNALIDKAALPTTHLVFLSPIEMETLGKPLPDLTAQNANVHQYAKVIREIAKKRRGTYVDLIGSIRYLKRSRSDKALTEDGLHLSAYGYWFSSLPIEQALSLDPINWLVWAPETGKIGVSQCKFERAKGTALKYDVLDSLLPRSPLPIDSPKAVPEHFNERKMMATDLGEGDYSLLIDGKETCKGAGKVWNDLGMSLVRGPEFDQVEKLRQTIVEKNRLYFHRWRPQNETYLFGFRKHEQGQNAREIPQFDPLIEKLEKEIAKLRVPVAHTYEIVPAK
ncbi:MAG TPA: SGNH/GDSL hydrolase family protein [Gemmataceae bacterium]|nr:SGNH/GDSL hydrolase family protein [Gemmataceae bacterium]